MIKIFPTIQIKELDAYTIENEPVTSIDLMERASQALAENNIRTLEYGNSFHSICRTRKQWRRCPCRFASAGAAGVSCRSISF